MDDAPTDRTPARGMWPLIKKVAAEADRKRLTLIGAGVAFYGLLALFPGIGAAMALAGIWADPADVANAFSGLTGVLPEAAAEIILGQAKQVASTESAGLGFAAVAGVMIALYSSSKGMQALIDGMNIMHGREESRGFFAATALKLALTFGLIVGVLLCVVIAVAIPAVLAMLPLAPDTELAVTIARWPVLLCIAALGIAFTYRVGPAGASPAWRWVLPGAGLACILWLTGTALFAVYVRLFATYQETFGTLGGVVILLMWLWLSGCAVLLGALVSRLLAERARADG